MIFWYFRFEGRFVNGSPKYGLKSVFSSCLVPVSVYRRAKIKFLETLRQEGIELIEIIEHFAIDEEELDPQDDQNAFWIKWYREAKSLGKPILDKYHVYDE
jgi:hypothetical protein